jgi:hypothetical protein
MPPIDRNTVLVINNQPISSALTNLMRRISNRASQYMTCKGLLYITYIKQLTFNVGIYIISYFHGNTQFLLLKITRRMEEMIFLSLILPKIIPVRSIRPLKSLHLFLHAAGLILSSKHSLCLVKQRRNPIRPHQLP